MTAFLIRSFDIIISASSLILLSPILIGISILIALTDPGPAFFRQQRVGRNRTSFFILKFRSMYVDKTRNLGDGTATTLEDKQKLRAAFQTAKENDPRVTPVGKSLRKTHLDELPQLINILLGHMSLVGVRPDTPVQEVDYRPEDWIERHKLRPGLTGITQINGAIRSMQDRIENDLYWVQNRTLLFYLKTIFRTFLKVAKRTSF